MYWYFWSNVRSSKADVEANLPTTNGSTSSRGGAGRHGLQASSVMPRARTSTTPPPTASWTNCRRFRAAASAWGEIGWGPGRRAPDADATGVAGAVAAAVGLPGNCVVGMGLLYVSGVGPRAA